MKNTFGNMLAVTVFGESHGEAVGCVIDGVTPGTVIDTDYISKKLALRRPAGGISTGRREKDEFRIVSGVFEGRATGTPLCIIIPNEDTHSADYSLTKDLARPGHADYTANIKYRGFQDYRGGGHFSARVTAALVAAGAVCMQMLGTKGIAVGTHIRNIGTAEDRAFNPLEPEISEIENKYFALLEPEKEEQMKKLILEASENGDSIGGTLETAVTGLPAGVGEPWFDSLEGLLSHALFSIPAVKGIEFGAGFGFARMRGSEANDPFAIKDGRTVTLSNNNGGINGGISNAMPVIFRLAVKPTPSIFKKQQTVNMAENKDASIEISGRHDPCVVHRARAVADAVTAMVLCDALMTKFGTDYFAE